MQTKYEAHRWMKSEGSASAGSVRSAARIAARGIEIRAVRRSAAPAREATHRPRTPVAVAAARIAIPPGPHADVALAEAAPGVSAPAAPGPGSAGAFTSASAYCRAWNSVTARFANPTYARGSRMKPRDASPRMPGCSSTQAKARPP